MRRGPRALGRLCCGPGGHRLQVDRDQGLSETSPAQPPAAGVLGSSMHLGWEEPHQGQGRENRQHADRHKGQGQDAGLPTSWPPPSTLSFSTCPGGSSAGCSLGLRQLTTTGAWEQLYPSLTGCVERPGSRAGTEGSNQVPWAGMRPGQSQSWEMGVAGGGKEQDLGDPVPCWDPRRLQVQGGPGLAHCLTLASQRVLGCCASRPVP